MSRDALCAVGAAGTSASRMPARNAVRDALRLRSAALLRGRTLGRGSIPMRECPDCYGKGLTGQDDRPGLLLPAFDCPRCRGTGEIAGLDETEPMIEFASGPESEDDGR